MSELAKKLEWAKLVDNMSESSNVVVLKEPRHLQDYEQVSPKLFTNIILGIVFGAIASLFAVIFAENTDKKLTYSMLSENIIYNGENDFTDLKVQILAKKDKKIACVMFEELSSFLALQLKDFKNLDFIKADISSEFVERVKNSEEVIIFDSINKTNSKFYKQIKQMLNEMNKEISLEVLI